MEAIAAGLNSLSVLPRNEQKLLPGRKEETTPLSNHLEKVLRDPLRDILPDDSEYLETFDWFEYLLALVHVDVACSPESLKPSAEGKQVEAWGPICCFGWRQRDKHSGLFAETELQEGQLAPDKVAKTIQECLFGGSPTGYERFRAIKSTIDRYCAKATWSWG